MLKLMKKFEEIQTNDAIQSADESLEIKTDDPIQRVDESLEIQIDDPIQSGDGSLEADFKHGSNEIPHIPVSLSEVKSEEIDSPVANLNVEASFETVSQSEPLDYPLTRSISKQNMLSISLIIFSSVMAALVITHKKKGKFAVEKKVDRVVEPLTMTNKQILDQETCEKDIDAMEESCPSETSGSYSKFSTLMAANIPAKTLKLTAVLLTYAICAAATLCPNCGPTPVPYPLSTGPRCGDQSYKIQCDAGVLKFNTLNNTYPIVSISSQNQRLVIRPFRLLPNTCVASDLPTRGIQLNPALPFNITFTNTVLFFNCTDSMLTSVLDCSPTSVCRDYMNGSPEMAACRRSPICCSFPKGGYTNVYVLPVAMERCSAYRCFVDLDKSLPVSRWPDPAVELEWVIPPEPPCETQADCDSVSICRDAGGGARRCFCKSKFHWEARAGLCASDLKCRNSKKYVKSKRIIHVAAMTTIGGIVFLVAIIVIIACIRHRHIKRARQQLVRERKEILTTSGGGKSAKIFTGKEIKRATNNFSRNGLLGVGGFGEVYKGTLDDGRTVAVKCAKIGNTKGVDQVLNEVRILCQVNHKNLVHLLGCCVELEQPMLVYEYILNGSLFDHLHGQKNKPLTWRQRLGIAHDTAEGLAYLHFSASPPIYHRDVKSSNILLDEKMKAKVADFGLSILAHSDLTHVTTCAQGTLGYLDPDYYWNYQLTDKSDVYSFGVLLLEILTCQRAIDFNRPTNDLNLVAYMKRIVNEERLMDAIDPMLTKHATLLDLDAIKALGFLAMSCLEEHRESRPSMKEVNEEIEYIRGIVATKEERLSSA